ncbi:MAG TPA: DUF2339 domain-containing protein [Conexibacter sp.]|nr:DUF2339 domain-containing protein [Conexibacter sp.]
MGAEGGTMVGQERLTRLEAELEALGERVALLERPVAAPPRVLVPLPPKRELAPPRVFAPRVQDQRPDVVHAAKPAAAATRPPTPTLRERLGLAAEDPLEDLFGGRVLAWVGGLAVFLGLIFLLAIAISHGWLGEGARVALAALLSSGLVAGGAWLHERTTRVHAAHAAVAAGIAGLFATVTVATRLYELVPESAGLTLGLLLGASATALAIRWDSRGIAALGILGAVAAPLLVDAGHAPDTLALLFVALAAAAGVLLWRRWDWLGLAAFALAAPQWIAFLFDNGSAVSVTVALVAFGGLGVAMAIGHDVRVGAPGLRWQPAFLLALNAVALAVAGWLAFESLDDPTAGKVWLAALAATHLAVGLAGPRLTRVSHELQLLSLTLGVVLTDVAFALVADGWVLALGWSAVGVAFAALQRHVGSGGRDGAFVHGGLGGHLALALVQALVVARPVDVLTGAESLTAAGVASVAALAAACLAAGRIAEQQDRAWRVVLDATAIAAVALLAAMALDGTALVLAWMAEGLVLAQVACRHDDRVAACGALGFLGLLVLHALVWEAPPASLASGLIAPGDAVVAVGAAAVLALLSAGWLPELSSRVRLGLRAGGAVALLYLASCLVVTPFAGGQAVEGALLDAQQQGQLALSVFWALVGLGALVMGLRRDVRVLRIGALALLGLAIAKVFLLDLATLTSVYRVGSFVGLGLLLLVSAFTWQRMRPREEVRSEDAEVDLECGIDGERGLQ